MIDFACCQGKLNHHQILVPYEGSNLYSLYNPLTTFPLYRPLPYDKTCDECYQQKNNNLSNLSPAKYNTLEITMYVVYFSWIEIRALHSEALDLVY